MQNNSSPNPSLIASVAPLIQNIKQWTSTIAGIATLIVLILQDPGVQSALTLTPVIAAYATKLVLIASATAFIFGKISVFSLESKQTDQTQANQPVQKE